MQWTKTRSGDWRLMHDGRILAEVQYNGDGTFRWQRFTTLATDGVLPGWGNVESKKEAMKRASEGIANGQPS